MIWMHKETGELFEMMITQFEEFYIEELPEESFYRPKGICLFSNPSYEGEDTDSFSSKFEFIGFI